MKRKASLGLLLLAVIFAGSLFGTWAYFSKTFKSDNNIATAAVFDVDVVNKNGQTIANAEFDLDEKLYPGMETQEVYNFDIKRNNTEVPLEYVVHLKKDGALFKEGTPVVVAIERNVDGNWVQVEPNLTFKPNNNVESFRILVNWPHGDNDIAFQGLNGSINLEVVASQVDPEEEVEEPAGPPYYSGAIEFKATPNGNTFKTSKKEINFYLNGKGERVVEVSMGDGSDTFENKVGNFRLVDEEDKNGKWVRLYTEKEYFASETQMWRASPKDVDLSKPGVIRINKVLGPYLLIESKELYDWYVANGSK